MATKFFTGKADPVAQVGTIEITGDDASTTYKVTIGGVVVSVAGSGTGVNDTASALQVALAASTHPYFAAITWTVATDTVTGTVKAVADSNGDSQYPEYVASTSVSGGTGTIGAWTQSTAGAGPNWANVAANWSDHSVPGASDIIIFPRGCPAVCWGLDDITAALTTAIVEKGAGRIGLRTSQFATAADGATFSTRAIEEYRDTYLELNADTIIIGENFGPDVAWAAGRVKIKEVQTTDSVIRVLDTPQSSIDSGKDAVRLLATDADVDLFIENAPGGCGLATDKADETATFGDIRISDLTTGTKVHISDGVTYTNYEQLGGDNIIAAAAGVTLVDAEGGNLKIVGDFTITTLNVKGAEVVDNHIKTSGNAVTTGTVTAGLLDLTQSLEPRTYNHIDPDGGTIKLDTSVITVTTFDEPASGIKSISVEA